jgi:hypothetical protein
MKNAILFCSALSVFLSSCKKEDTHPDSEATLPCAYNDTTALVGAFENSVYSDNFGNSGLLVTSQSAIARFCKEPMYWPCNDITNNQVSINTHTLSYYGNAGCSSSYLLPWSTNTINLNNDNWSVSGDSILAFNYTYRTPFPVVSTVNNIPDSINKSGGSTFTINISNVIAGTLVIADSSQSLTNVNAVTYNLSNGINVISLSPSQLSNWATNNSGFISLKIQNFLTVAVSCGRNYRFIKSYQVVKKLKINP